MKFRKEYKIGIIVTLIIFFFLWGYNFLKGRNLFSSYNYYYAHFSNVEGLQESATVDVNGLVVGLVSDIDFVSGRLDSLTVEIAVKKKLNISKNTVVMLNSGLLKGKSIGLMLGSGTPAVNGDTLRSVVMPGVMDMIDPIVHKLDKTIDSVNLTLKTVQNTLDDDTQANVRSIVANLEQLVSSERLKIRLILSNFESVSTNLKKNNEDISLLISNLTAFSRTLTASDVKMTVDKANQSLTQLNALLEGINNGQGTLGQLARNDSAYVFLQRSLEDLDKLLIDLRKNPREYVHFSLFGKKTKTK
ncbi:MAG: MlaD family protein [Bacteroidales bacterium]|jgi:phospholipid/cholesterol/gamma-HCH transport system substrate-binding protein|nr:MlaD family protein [Bacteroidales bacterium]